MLEGQINTESAVFYHNKGVFLEDATMSVGMKEGSLLMVCPGTCLLIETGKSGQKAPKGLFSDSGKPVISFPILSAETSHMSLVSLKRSEKWSFPGV